MVLSEDYTPKYTVAESRLFQCPIPLSLAAARGGIGGFSHPPSGNSRWDVSRIREKVAYLPPGRGPGRGSVLFTFGYPLSIGSINLSESLTLRKFGLLIASIRGLQIQRPGAPLLSNVVEPQLLRASCAIRAADPFAHLRCPRARCGKRWTRRDPARPWA